MNVTEFYEHELKQRGYQSDEAQLRAVERLQRCYDEWVAYKSRRNNALKKLLVTPTCPRASTCGAGWGAARAS
jgi:cell division protein ZapE